MDTNLSRYTFGVEFEVVLPTALVNQSIAAARLSQATGLTVALSSRIAATPQDSQAWRIVHDGSIRTGGAGFGAELVSPILRGQDGLEQVEKIARAIVALGGTVNQSCGFHVHVGLRGADLAFFKNLVKLYAKYEPVIDSMMAPSRRGGTNVYCRSLARVDSARIDAAPSLEAVIEATTGLGQRDYSQRFFKLNLAAFRKHSTVEFRQHAGTTDATKAVNWIVTCLRMVHAARNGKTGAARTAAPTSFDHLRDAKTRRVAEFVSRPAGATRREVIEGTGWSALSINRQARLAGIIIREVRVRGESRFYAVAADATETPIDLGAFVALIEASEQEAAWMHTRCSELQA